MKRRGIFLSICLIAISVFGQTELVIQQGLNGYSGFSDRMESNNDYKMEPEDYKYVGVYNYTC